MNPDELSQVQPSVGRRLPSSRNIASGALLACVLALLGLFSYPPAGLGLSVLALLLAGRTLAGIRNGRLSADGRQLAVVALCVGCVIVAGGLLQSLVLQPLGLEDWAPLKAIRLPAIQGTPAPR